MKIAICQYDMAWEDKEANKGKISKLMDACSKKGQAEWLVFPEMTLSAFSMNRVVATLSPGDEAFFGDLARKHGLAVSYGGVQDGFNKLITLDKTGRKISEYSKIHLYSFGKEDQGYRPGEKQTTFALGGLSVTPAICFDLRFPYLFWRTAEQTDLFVVIASWPMRRAEHWMTLLRARAVENQAYVVGVNRIGVEPSGVEYSGNSMIFDPLGKVVLDCVSNEGVFIAETDADKGLVSKTRERFPFFKDRRKEPAFA